MRLFLYGSLRDPATLAARAGDPAMRDCWQPAELPGWRVVALRLSRYPTLIRARAVACGIIAEVDGPALARLQRYEGDAYRLHNVTVHTAGAVLPAKAWIAPGGTRRPWPRAAVPHAATQRTTL